MQSLIDTGIGALSAPLPQYSKGTLMSYLEDFKKYVKKNHYPEVTKLWEEYCQGDELDGEELIEILELMKKSEMAIPFGRHVERILPLLRKNGPLARERDLLSPPSRPPIDKP